jgi:hypothetical protein
MKWSDEQCVPKHDRSPNGATLPVESRRVNVGRADQLIETMQKADQERVHAPMIR